MAEAANEDGNGNGNAGPEAAAPADAAKAPKRWTPLVTVVGFHHARGPEIESWFGVAESEDPAVDNDWSLLPFMALSDGAHASTEDFSYFTLLRPAAEGRPATSLFGISCTRQMDSSQLLVRPDDVTRSTVQKAVVVIADSPQSFGMMRERLGVVTTAWFAQREFGDVEILRRFQESLADEHRRGLLEADRDLHLGMSLRELVHEFRWQTLVLLKCCLLQPKMLFFGSRCERLCMMQFSLLSLIPGLIRNLQDAADPELNSYEKDLKQATSLRTSDRNSLLSYMGLPLQIFGKGSLFGPYTPLQQLDLLADYGTKSYIVGSTNSLLLQQRDRYSDILINLDEDTITITSPSLRAALQLSAADRRWIDFITQEVNETWDDANPSRPNTMGYVGSEEFIRLQFEEYLLSLISCVKYHSHLVKHANNPRMMLPDVEGDPSSDFNAEWVETWLKTENHRIWSTHTDSHIFDIVEPRHPCAGGLTIDDVQRRISQQVQDLHLDERFAQGREVLGRNLAAGREKASTMLNKLYADMEALREAQRKKAEEARQQQLQEKRQSSQPGSPRPPTTPGVAPVELGKAQQTVQTVGSRAGAYVSSWASWAEGKRKAGWGRPAGSSNSGDGAGPVTGNRGSGGWGFRGKKTGAGSTSSHGSGTLGPASESGEMQMMGVSASTSPRISTSSRLTGYSSGSTVAAAGSASGESGAEPRRPMTQESFGESILDGATTSSSSTPASPERFPEKPAPRQPGAISPPPRAPVGLGLGLGIDETLAAEGPAAATSLSETGEEGLAVRGEEEEVPETGSGALTPVPVPPATEHAVAEERAGGAE